MSVAMASRACFTAGDTASASILGKLMSPSVIVVQRRERHRGI